jgi:Xaa-Pro dipeptidase
MTDQIPDLQSAVGSQLSSLYKIHLEHVTQVYQKAARQAGKDGVLIASGALKQTFLDDQTYPFKVNPHFKAWLPVTDVEDSYLLLRENKKPQLLFHQPEDYWHLPAQDPTGFWVDEWDIESIKNVSDAHNHLGDVRDLAFIGEDVQQPKDWGIDRINDETMLDSIHFNRAYKTDYEITCLAHANNIAVRGHVAAEAAFREGMSEFEIQTAYLSAIGHREQQTPYSGIVALNEHCAVLHYQHYEHLRHGQSSLNSLLIDAGANCNGYAADITRTYAHRSGLFEDLITAMNEAQLTLIDTIEVGMDYTKLNFLMHQKLALLLKQFKIIDMSVDEMVQKNITFNFMPHGLGHFLGLQTHDVSGFQQSEEGDNVAAPDNYPSLRLTRKIEDRQVFTIEPGIYFIPMLLKQLQQTEDASSVNWSLIESLLPYGGIRIEDNIAMINGQTRNLTREAFTQL